MTRPPDSAWDIHFFARIDPVRNPRAPAKAFLDTIPEDAAMELMATLDAVADGPPPSFRGGLRYQAMRGDMTGWHEARTKHQKLLYWVFVRQDREAPGLPRSALVLIAGGVKKNETAFTKSFYKEIRKLGEEYLSSNPRSVLGVHGL